MSIKVDEITNKAGLIEVMEAVGCERTPRRAMCAIALACPLTESTQI